MILRWARNGAAVGVALAVVGLLVPTELGGYAAPRSMAALIDDFAAILTTVLVGALTGAALGGLASHRRRRTHHQPR